MSRIERALEDALRRREGLSEAEIVERDEPGTRPIPEERSPSPRLRAILPENGEHDRSAMSPFISAALEETSAVAEHYRRICLNIVKRVNADQGNVLLVTSSIRGEGKTITAVNLACTLARSIDHTVLLVDADLRHPRVHEYLGLEPAKGLADYLSMEDVLISDLLIRPGLGKLVVLQGGSPVENPSELLVSSKMEDLLGELKFRYPDRFIIVDSGPVLEVADPSAMAAWMDGVIFVVREGEIPRKTVMEGFDIVRESRVLGVVMNDSGPYLMASHSGGGYGYGYGYGARIKE